MQFHDSSSVLGGFRHATPGTGTFFSGMEDMTTAQLVEVMRDGSARPGYEPQLTLGIDRSSACQMMAALEDQKHVDTRAVLAPYVCR